MKQARLHVAVFWNKSIDGEADDTKDGQRETRREARVQSPEVADGRWSRIPCLVMVPFLGLPRGE